MTNDRAYTPLVLWYEVLILLPRANFVVIHYKSPSRALSNMTNKEYLHIVFHSVYLGVIYSRIVIE